MLLNLQSPINCETFIGWCVSICKVDNQTRPFGKLSSSHQGKSLGSQTASLFQWHSFQIHISIHLSAETSKRNKASQCRCCCQVSRQHISVSGEGLRNANTKPRNSVKTKVVIKNKEPADLHLNDVQTY